MAFDKSIRSIASDFTHEMSRKHSSSTSEVAEKLWEDFKQAIYEGDENQVTRILLESSDGRKPHPFLTKKISTTEVSTIYSFQVEIDLKSENRLF